MGGVRTKAPLDKPCCPDRNQPDQLTTRGRFAFMRALFMPLEAFPCLMY